jgi:hypothetical protein
MTEHSPLPQMRFFLLAAKALAAGLDALVLAEPLRFGGGGAASPTTLVPPKTLHAGLPTFHGELFVSSTPANMS